MGPETLIVKQFRRVSPSRYTAMQTCLLREAWNASGNEPLLPPSPVAELGSVVHRLLEAAARGQLDDGGNGKIQATWEALISQAEKKMSKLALRKYQVPLCKSIPDFEVRKLRAYHRAAEIAHDVFLMKDGLHKRSSEPIGFELWVESNDGLVGGYIDRVMLTKDGVILSDFKSGAILDFGTEECSGEIKREYKEQLKLYAALYRLKCGTWPIRLEVIPLQGSPAEVAFEREESERLLAEASIFLQFSNQRIAKVQNGDAEITSLASPKAVHCRFCLFRPACQAYWSARQMNLEEKWPADVRGFLKEMTRLRNKKVCLRILQKDSSSSTCVTVRNLTDCADRHPLLDIIKTGNWVAIYGLRYDYHSSDYIETQNTVIFGED